eukprot:gene9804-13193_t
MDSFLSGYENVCCLGKGRFGKVNCYKNKSNPSDLVAVKSVNSDTCNEYEFLRTLMKSSMYIVQMIEIEISTTNIILMKAYLGGSLHLHLKALNRIESSITSIIVMQLICALMHLYSHGIIHCDLKANNCVLDENYRVVLCDFGNAKRICTTRNFSKKEKNESDVQLTAFRAMHHSAPESVTDSAFGMSVDWWALGVLTFELLTGSYPMWKRNKLDETTSFIRSSLRQASAMPKAFESLESEAYIAERAIYYSSLNISGSMVIGEYSEEGRDDILDVCKNWWDINSNENIETIEFFKSSEDMREFRRFIGSLLIIDPFKRTGPHLIEDIKSNPIFKWYDWNDVEIGIPLIPNNYFDNRVGYLDLFPNFVSGTNYSYEKSIESSIQNDDLTDEQQLLFADF